MLALLSLFWAPNKTKASTPGELWICKRKTHDHKLINKQLAPKDQEVNETIENYFKVNTDNICMTVGKEKGKGGSWKSQIQM